MSAIEVKVPDIGDFKEVPVIESGEAGRRREAEESLVTLESDKATMDVPSPVAGVVKELKVKVGDKVPAAPSRNQAPRRRRPERPGGGVAEVRCPTSATSRTCR
jgi:hypothetical protein